MMSEVIRITQEDLGFFFKTKIGNDINLYLIHMFKAIAQGWVPPEQVDEETYNLAKKLDERFTRF